MLPASFIIKSSSAIGSGGLREYRRHKLNKIIPWIYDDAEEPLTLDAPPITLSFLHQSSRKTNKRHQ